MADFSQIDNIDDEDVLESMINQTEDIEIRRKIRRKQSNIRQRRTAEWEAQRKARAEALGGEDALALKLRRAEEEKQRIMKTFEEKAKELKNEQGAGELALRQRMEQAEIERQQRLQHLNEMGRIMQSTYNMGVMDIMKQQKDGAGRQNAASDVASAQLFPTGNSPGKQSSTAKQQGLGGIQYSFKKPGNDSADQANSAANRQIERNPSAIKQVLLDWCKKQCEGYENVNITNFSTSWADGLAFCALIHHFYPNAFDFSQLNPKNRRGNFTLAFESAEKLADIAPLLDVEDMVRMKSPDWKCVFTYVQGFYRRFAMPQAKQSQHQMQQAE